MSEYGKVLEYLESQANYWWPEYVTMDEAIALQNLIVEMHDAHARTEAELNHRIDYWRGRCLELQQSLDGAE